MTLPSLQYLYAKFVKNYVRGKALRHSSVHPTSKIGSGSSIVCCSFDRYSYCGSDCLMVNVRIGAFCSIADNVIIGVAQHPMDWVSTSPVFQNTRHSGPQKRFCRKEVATSPQTVIGSDVWIGNGVKIKAGVTIGHGAVVGMGSVVTKDVEPYSIVAGCPAKHIRYRFDKEIITKLLATQWWTMDDVQLVGLADNIDSPEAFLKSLQTKSKIINVGGGI